MTKGFNKPKGAAAKKAAKNQKAIANIFGAHDAAPAVNTTTIMPSSSSFSPPAEEPLTMEETAAIIAEHAPRHAVVLDWTRCAPRTEPVDMEEIASRMSLEELREVMWRQKQGKAELEAWRREMEAKVAMSKLGYGDEEAFLATDPGPVVVPIAADDTDITTIAAAANDAKTTTTSAGKMPTKISDLPEAQIHDLLSNMNNHSSFAARGFLVPPPPPPSTTTNNHEAAVASAFATESCVEMDQAIEKVKTAAHTLQANIRVGLESIAARKAERDSDEPVSPRTVTSQSVADLDSEEIREEKHSPVDKAETIPKAITQAPRYRPRRLTRRIKSLELRRRRTLRRLKRMGISVSTRLSPLQAYGTTPSVGAMEELEHEL